MSTKKYCDKCQEEIKGVANYLRINQTFGVVCFDDDDKLFNARYDLCKSCLLEVVELLEGK